MRLLDHIKSKGLTQSPPFFDNLFRVIMQIEKHFGMQMALDNSWPEKYKIQWRELIF